MVVLLLQTSLLVLGGCGWHLLSNSSCCQIEGGGEASPWTCQQGDATEQSDISIAPHWLLCSDCLCLESQLYLAHNFIDSTSDLLLPTLMFFSSMQIISRLGIKCVYFWLLHHCLRKAFHNWESQFLWSGQRQQRSKTHFCWSCKYLTVFGSIWYLVFQALNTNCSDTLLIMDEASVYYPWHHSLWSKQRNWRNGKLEWRELPKN